MSRHQTQNKLTTIDAVFVTVGTMIGAGIFSVFSLTIQTAGPSAILSWIFVVLFSLPMAYTFSDLTGALAESGGSLCILAKQISMAWIMDSMAIPVVGRRGICWAVYLAYRHAEAIWCTHASGGWNCDCSHSWCDCQ